MRTVLVCLVGIAVVGGGAAGAAPADRNELVVVVGRESPARVITLDTVRDVFLRRQRLWPDGARAMPVNLPADTAMRRDFSRAVLGRLPGELVEYWNRLYFDGIRPPVVLRSPAAVCAYVATEPAALAYVPRNAVDERRCRVVLPVPGTGEER